MAGRFFSAPVLLAAILLTLEMHRYGTRPAACAIALLLLLNMSALNLTLFSPARFAATSIQPSGIADERGFYYQALGLVPVLQRGTWFVHPWLLEGRAARAAGGTQVRCFIGMAGYTGGPEVHWIDPLALSEPFLARLPSRTNARVGHYERAFPAGYFESMAAHKNLIADARMAALYEDVDLAVRAPLLADGRLAAIWRLNSGSHADAAKNFDREAVGMPGVRIWNHSPFSCLGK
jgi:arabinofuranosyltransferase